MKYSEAFVNMKKKGLYSIEKFLLARKLMYLQVYTHKTVLSAEYTLMNILKRAKEIFEFIFKVIFKLKILKG